MKRIAWMAVAVGLFAREVLGILVPSGYADAAVVVPPVVAAYVVRGIAALYHYLLIHGKRTRTIGTGLVLEAALNLGLNLWLIPRHGGCCSLVARLTGPCAKHSSTLSNRSTMWNWTLWSSGRLAITYLRPRRPCWTTRGSSCCGPSPKY